MSRKRPTFEIQTETDVLDTVSTRQASPTKKTDTVTDISHVAEEAGFGTRQLPKVREDIIDARSLRKTNRSAQLNISVRPETRNAFWKYAQANGFFSGEDALLSLLEKSITT